MVESINSGNQSRQCKQKSRRQFGTKRSVAGFRMRAGKQILKFPAWFKGTFCELPSDNIARKLTYIRVGKYFNWNRGGGNVLRLNFDKESSILFGRIESIHFPSVSNKNQQQTACWNATRPVRARVTSSEHTGYPHIWFEITLRSSDRHNPVRMGRRRSIIPLFPRMLHQRTYVWACTGTGKTGHPLWIPLVIDRRSIEPIGWHRFIDRNSRHCSKHVPPFSSPFQFIAPLSGYFDRVDATLGRVIDPVASCIASARRLRGFPCWSLSDVSMDSRVISKSYVRCTYKEREYSLISFQLGNVNLNLIFYFR